MARHIIDMTAVYLRNDDGSRPPGIATAIAELDRLETQVALISKLVRTLKKVDNEIGYRNEKPFYVELGNDVRMAIAEAERVMEVKYRNLCLACLGSGVKENSDGYLIWCPDCHEEKSKDSGQPERRIK
jgi:hypothetical protein